MCVQGRLSTWSQFYGAYKNIYCIYKNMHYIDFKLDASTFETNGLISVPNDFTVWDTE